MKCVSVVFHSDGLKSEWGHRLKGSESPSVQGVRLGVHAGLPGVARHVGHGDEEQGHAAQDEQGEGGAGAGERPGVVVLDPDGLIAGDHALDRLAHHLHRNDDAEA